MIRYVQCVRRKPGLSTEQFRRYWQNYQLVAESFATLAEARRMSVGVGLEIPLNAEIQSLRGTMEPFDAILEIWWDSGADLVRVTQQPAIHEKIEALQQMQQDFISLQDSSFFFASEDVEMGSSF